MMRGINAEIGFHDDLNPREVWTVRMESASMKMIGIRENVMVIASRIEGGKNPRTDRISSGDVTAEKINTSVLNVRIREAAVNERRSLS
jgi:hypothetical protein